MSDLGQTEKSGRATGKSALPSITDIVRQARQVRKVPETEVAGNAEVKSRNYSVWAPTTTPMRVL
jgi:hypothetical protein